MEQLPPGGWQHALLPLLSTIACLTFSAMVLRQFVARRRPYQLVWSVGLLLYGIATATEVVGNVVGWNALLYRWWYLAGAVSVAAMLGLGEVYLLRGSRFGYLVAAGVFAGAIPAFFTGLSLARAGDPAGGAVIALAVNGVIAATAIAVTQRRSPDNVGHVVAAALAIGFAVAARQVFTTPVDLASILDPDTGIAVGGAFPPQVRLITPLFNIPGAAALFGGAAWSAWSYYHRGTMPHRVKSNVLIAAGALVPTLTSTLNRFGVTELFYLGELIGILLIFAGFLVSIEVFAELRLRRLAGLLGRVAT